MGSSRSTTKTSGDASTVDTDSDRFPSLNKVLHLMRDLPDMPTGPVQRVEVHLHASGEATYNVWAARAEEPVGGYIPDANS